MSVTDRRHDLGVRQSHKNILAYKMSSKLIRLEEDIYPSLFGQGDFGVEFCHLGQENNLAFLRTTFSLLYR